VKDPENRNMISNNLAKIQSLARLNQVEFSEAISGNLLRGVSRLGEFGLDVQDAINIQAERERLKKEAIRIESEIEKILKKINSQDFLARAPEEIVAENRERHQELVERLHKIESNLSHLPVV
jgi:valyl-tRNA synthetase